ncbi:MAG: hypothetical protein OXC31_16475 [Spirochaetaceae bacterium]|nr:hypothetical protein [Spirochaetaceae bacterium]
MNKEGFIMGEKRFAKRRPERPRDPAELGRLVVEMATGQRPNDSFEDGEPPEPEGRARGGTARAAAMTPERRREIAKKAAAARWGKG